MTEEVSSLVEAPHPGPSIRRVAMMLTSGALFSKGLGFVREIIMAQIIGVAAVADSFRSSITIILLPLAFLQNESVPAILIPRMRDAQRDGQAPRLLAAMTVALTTIAVLLMLLTMAGAALLVHAMLSGVSAEEKATTIYFVHIMALSMPASVAINCLASGEIVLGKTRLTIARATILNVGIIFGLGMLVLTGESLMLAIAFSLAFNALAVWALWILWREGNLSFSQLRFSDIWSEARTFMKKLVPFMPLPAAEQANVWLERLLASRLATGVIASMDYARTLTDSSLLLVSQPIGLAVLSRGSGNNIGQQAQAITRFVLILMVPASVYIFIFAPDIISLVFKRGAFGETGVRLTSEALRGISVGLWASTLGWILLRLLNGSNRNTLAAVILVAAYCVNLGVNLATAKLQQSSDFGVMLLGLGETARSLVLCFAVILALEGRMQLLRLLAVGLLPAALMVAITWEISATVAGTLPRLFLGVGGYGISVLFAAALLAPGVYAKVFSSVFSRKGKKPDA